MKYITVLGTDPGTANFAFSVTRVKINAPFRYKVLKTGMIENTVRDLTGLLDKQSEAFKKEIKALVKEYDVDVIMAERFMNRGRNGNTGELVSFMLGLMKEIKGTHLTLLTAAQWKNAFNRIQDLKALYKESSLVAHRIDAACISIYGASMYLDVPAFKFLEKASRYAKFKKKLEATNKEVKNAKGKAKGGRGKRT